MNVLQNNLQPPVRGQEAGDDILAISSHFVHLSRYLFTDQNRHSFTKTKDSQSTKKLPVSLVEQKAEGQGCPLNLGLLDIPQTINFLSMRCFVSQCTNANFSSAFENETVDLLPLKTVYLHELEAVMQMK